MKKGKKKFCTVTTRIVGKLDDKTMAIHFSAKDRTKAIKFASGVFQALAHGKGIDITFSHQKTLKTKMVKITIAAPK